MPRVTFITLHSVMEAPIKHKGGKDTRATGTEFYFLLEETTLHRSTPGLSRRNRGLIRSKVFSSPAPQMVVFKLKAFAVRRKC